MDSLLGFCIMLLEVSMVYSWFKLVIDTMVDTTLLMLSNVQQWLLFFFLLLYLLVDLCWLRVTFELSSC